LKIALSAIFCGQICETSSQISADAEENEPKTQVYMFLIADINDIPPLDYPCGVTIGSFDGVHLGHQALLKHLRAKLPPNGLLTVFTFSSHPSHSISPNSPTPLICPPLQKAKLLSDYGADIVILTPFTPEFSKTPFDLFLRLLKQKLPFSYLVLGKGATFGSHKEGNEHNVRRLAPELEFEVEYLSKFSLHSQPISSGHIRTLISQAALHKVQDCLGRPYSIMGHLNAENGYYTLNAIELCLPPEGTYLVHIKTASQTHLAKAQITPKEHKIRLEPLKENAPIQSKEAEVIFT
jgi:riboflavin kinase/FMN adenylyltransferase